MREHKRDKEFLTIRTFATAISIPKRRNHTIEKQLFTTFYGLVKQVEIIGEAANLLTIEFRESHSEVDWRPIVNMRNVLVHDYIHISKDILWVTLTQDIPELKKHIERYYYEMNS